jgi:hypothetical protein
LIFIGFPRNLHFELVSHFFEQPMLRQSVSFNMNPKANNDVLRSAVTLTADDSGRLTARQVVDTCHVFVVKNCTWRFQFQCRLCLTFWQYVPVKPQKIRSSDSNLLARMEKALFEVKFEPCGKIKTYLSIRCCGALLCLFHVSQMYLILQWAQQSKLLQRAQERNNNEDGVGCLGTQVSLLDPKLMPTEPKTRRVPIFCQLF